jgi:hypothetical protein
VTILVDPEIQRRYDRTCAAHREAGAAVARELRARQQEIAELVRASREPAPPGPSESARRLEDNDLSARAVDYQEPDEDVPEPPPPAPVVRPVRDEDDEVASFRWDEV